MVVDICEKHPDRARCFERTQALGPLDDYDGGGIIENFLEPETVQHSSFYPV